MESLWCPRHDSVNRLKCWMNSYEQSGLGCSLLSHQPNSADKQIPVYNLTEHGILGFETLGRSR